MIVYGKRINYEGDLSTLPVVQAGKYKIIAVRRYHITPAGLMKHFLDAEKCGAQFLVIDPQSVTVDYPEFIQVPNGVML